MEKDISELMAYNAIALHGHGSYPAIKKIKATHTTWRTAFDALAARETTIPNPEREWERLGRAGVKLILLDDEHYPFTLREIPQPPFGLYVRGDAVEKIAAVPRIFIGIVGTRRAMAESKEIAKHFSQELTRAGCGIVSGLAFGVDAAAHLGCLDAAGMTIAVFAGGLDDIYPHSHEHIAEKILSTGGSLVSEYPLGESPLPYRFIERNRIISGLSRGVLVIEAPAGSGSLATARYALDQNRDVFVVPGNILLNNFKGSHELIRQGATLVVSAHNILESYDITPPPISMASYPDATLEEMLILKALAKLAVPTDVDKIIEITRLEPRIASLTISFLLIKDFIKEVDGKYRI